MTERAETVVRELLAHFHDGWPEDLDEATSRLAEDATYQMSVPAVPQLVGRAAIRAELVRQKGYVTDQRHELRNVAAGQGVVFVERVDRAEMLGNVVEIPIAAVFDVSPAGEVVAWREYMDLANVAAQLGITAEQLLAAIAPQS